jgi:hypothetical protein
VTVLDRLPVGRVSYAPDIYKKAPVSWKLRNLPNRLDGVHKRMLAKVFGIATFEGALYLRLMKADGGIVDYGCVGKRVVTTAFVNYVVDAMQADVTFELFKYHGFGTGSNAEAVGNTGLHTELTTEYATNSTRPTGTQLEGATANIYRSVGTLDPDAAVAITEHGLFLADTGATTLCDRTLFSAVNVAASGDTLEATYELTYTAGS